MNAGGEFTIIENIARIAAPTLEEHPEIHCGIGDDCAITAPAPGMLQVSSTDMLLEHIHFDLLTTPVAHLGSKAVSVNVSDICAMNAIPRHILVALAVPPYFPAEKIMEFYAGATKAATTYGVAIIGGDTSASRSGLVISISISGEAAPERICRRNGASPGDLICLTGAVGGAAAGLRLLMREKEIMLHHLAQQQHDAPLNPDVMTDLEQYRRAIQRQLLPTARMDIIRFFYSSGLTPTSMIDISDGLASELNHLCKASGTGAVIDEQAIMIDEQSRLVADEVQEEALAWALSGGEDYELLFTIPEQARRVVAEHPDITVIGSMLTRESGIWLVDRFGIERNLEEIRGFEHFMG